MLEWTRDLPFSRSYVAIVVAVAVVVTGLAVFGQSSTLALAAAVLGLYVLHLFSNWQLASEQRRQWQNLREVEGLLGDLEEPSPTPSSREETITPVGEPREEDGEETGEPSEGADTSREADQSVLVPRRYRLGTVAVVRRVLTPMEVSRVLAVQERQPDRQFGDIALELGLLSESELEELLAIQQEGLYHPENIERARQELKEYRRRKAEELGTGPR